MEILRIIEDPKSWKMVTDRLERGDFYYSYEYGLLMAKEENGTILSAYFEDEDGKVFYPFIKRKVQGGNGLYDIVTPYGYGGPLVEGNRKQIIKKFYKNFSEYCVENQIITETIRFHPLYKNHTLLKDVLDVQYIRQTTAVDLTLPIESIRENYSTMTKRNVKKARKNDVTCFTANRNIQNIRIFREMYQETMDRNHASKYYYFTEDYFIEQMKDTNLGSPYLLFAQYENEIIAGVIVFVGKEYAHYHLGASKSEFFSVRANNLLFDYMIEFCQSKDLKLLHLGGGYRENDGLFKYKSSFTNSNNYDYYLGKKIYDEETYDSIVSSLENSHTIDCDYFPAYRGISPKIVANSK